MSSLTKEVEKSILYLKAFRAYQDETAQNLMDISESSAKQLVAVNLCLDLAYRARAELSRSESSKDLIESIEEITICNREIVEKIGKAAASMKLLAKALERIDNL